MANKTKMAEIYIPYKDSKIGVHEIPNWTKGQFLKSPNIEHTISKTIDLPLVNPDDHVDQNSNNNFFEFELRGIVETTGFHAEVMRSHGCGISATYMALRTIADRSFNDKFTTVGQFTLSALSNHKNDLVQDGQVVVGTPVFNLRSGWYHDALVFSAMHYGKVDGFRIEDSPSLENVGEICADLIEDPEKKVISIISVRNEFWRLATENTSVSTHMVLVNGFEFADDGFLKRIRITDSYVSEDSKINTWIEVTENVRKSFTGKAIFLIGK